MSSARGLGGWTSAAVPRRGAARRCPCAFFLFASLSFGLWLFPILTQFTLEVRIVLSEQRTFGKQFHSGLQLAIPVLRTWKGSSPRPLPRLWSPCLAAAAQVTGRGPVVGVSQTLTVRQEPGLCASPPGPGTMPDPQLALRTHPWRAGQGLGLARSVLSSPHLAQVADAGPQKPTRVPP